MLNVQLNVFMLMVSNDAFMLSVIMQSVVMLHVFMLSVAIPKKTYFEMLKRLRAYVSVIQSFKVLFKLDYPSLLPY
jgi:hypothetical protein